MTVSDFSQPRRMSLVAFFVILTNTIKRLIAPFIVMLIPFFHDSDAADGDFFRRLLIIIGVAFSAAIVIAFCRYFFQKFYVEDSKLIFDYGFLSKNSTSIPLSKIHTLRTKRGLIYRILGLRGISFDTLATNEKEVELILEESDWRRLLKRIDVQEQSSEEVAEPEHVEKTTDIKISNIEIVEGALCQNHLKGFAVIFALLGYIVNHLNDLGDNIIDEITLYVESEVEGLSVTAVLVAEVCIAAYLICTFLMVVRALLRNGNMSLYFSNDKLTIGRGLISRFSSRFSRDKVSAIDVRENPIEKKFGFSTTTLRQAAFATENNKSQLDSISSRNISRTFLTWWLGEDYDASPEIFMARSGRGVMFRYIMKGLLAAAVCFAALAYFDYPVAACSVAASCFVLMTVFGFFATKRSFISLHNDYIVIGASVPVKKMQYVKWSKVEDVAVRCTPFTRFYGRAALRIGTNASSYIIPSLNLKEAEKMGELILALEYSRSGESDSHDTAPVDE